VPRVSLVCHSWGCSVGPADRALGSLTPSSVSPDRANTSATSGEWLRPAPLERSISEEALPRSAEAGLYAFNVSQSQNAQTSQPRTHSVESITLGASERSNSPPPVPIDEAVNRAMKLSRKLSDSNIRTKVTEAGDLMLDMTGFKSTEDDALRAELIARKILAEELEGNYDIGSLIGADDQGNLWIYSSQEAKEIAQRKATLHSLHPKVIRHNDAASDPGYHSDDGQSIASAEDTVPSKGPTTASVSDGMITPPKSPPDAATVAELSRNYAKTLRLTSDQLKALHLKPGMNSMSFNVNRATCQAYMYYWTHDVPIVVSDIDGTITK
jgi:phosphatidate phosphatase LPIN